MKLDSKFFDIIRVKPVADRDPAVEQRRCQWKGCEQAGTHKAPRGRGHEGQYYSFCLDHVRRFNASYNYFTGMSDAEVEAFQKGAVTGHRPTWRLGAHGGSAGEAAAARAGRPYLRASRDPHRVLDNSDAATHSSPRSSPPRALKPLERKALESLNLPHSASRVEIKARFKLLVKRHHPDANGGDKGAEDKLRDIIQAYNYLKQAGLV